MRENRKIIITMISSLLLSAVISVLILFLLAFFMLKLSPEMETMEIGIAAIYIISCFCGGRYCGKVLAHKKYLWGIIHGLLYYLVLFLIAWMGEQGIPAGVLHNGILFFICGASGMIGGMSA